MTGVSFGPGLGEATRAVERILCCGTLTGVCGTLTEVLGALPGADGTFIDVLGALAGACATLTEVLGPLTGACGTLTGSSGTRAKISAMHWNWVRDIGMQISVSRHGILLQAST